MSRRLRDLRWSLLWLAYDVCGAAECLADDLRKRVVRRMAQAEEIDP